MKINRSKKFIYRRRALALASVSLILIVSVTCSHHKKPSVAQAAPIASVVTTTSTTISTTTVTQTVSVQANDNNDVEVLARLIQSEADGENYAGKLAVGTVVMNRVNDGRWGDSISKVVSAKGQFNGYNSDLYNEDLHTDNIKAAEEVIHGYRVFGPQVIYYFNDKIATDRAFMKTVNVVMTVGNHKFGTDKKGVN